MRRPRTVVERELLRSDLDVNLAVNNLLSIEDPEMGRSGVDGDVDLSQVGRASQQAAFVSRHANPAAAANAFSQAENVNTVGRNKKGELFADSQHWQYLFSEHEQLLQEKQSEPLAPALRIRSIAALKSELLCVNDEGRLLQWKWCEPPPQAGKPVADILHPATARYSALRNGCIQRMEACPLRATMLVAVSDPDAAREEDIESLHLVTLVDASFHRFSQLLEGQTCVPNRTYGAATPRPVELSVCPFYSLLLFDNGDCYWWGVQPFAVSFRMRAEPSRPTGDMSMMVTAEKDSQEIRVGSRVRLRSRPVVDTGTMACHCRDGYFVSFGELTMPCWGDSDIDSGALLDFTLCDASKTDTSAPISSGRRDAAPLAMRKRKRDEPTLTEKWPLTEVVFLEESHSRGYGTVIKLDGQSAVVFFGDAAAGVQASSSTPTLGTSSLDAMMTSTPVVDVLDKCRIVLKDELATRGMQGSTCRLASLAQPLPFLQLGAEAGLSISGKRVVSLCMDRNGSRVFALVASASSARASVLSYSFQENKIDKVWKFSSHVPPLIGPLAPWPPSQHASSLAISIPSPPLVVDGRMRCPRLLLGAHNGRVPAFVLIDRTGAAYPVELDAQQKASVHIRYAQ